MKCSTEWHQSNAIFNNCPLESLSNDPLGIFFQMYKGTKSQPYLSPIVFSVKTSEMN